MHTYNALYYREVNFSISFLPKMILCHQVVDKRIPNKGLIFVYFGVSDKLCALLILQLASMNRKIKSEDWTDSLVFPLRVALVKKLTLM